MKPALTQADIDTAYDDLDWLGYGYLGTRKNAVNNIERIREADERLLREVNQQGWTKAQFFAWLNSKLGRWYGEAWFHGAADLERDIEHTVTLKGLI